MIALPVPGERIDRYDVVGVLGQGGMATVYQVRHAELHTVHALKVLQIVTPGLQERLLQEGRIQASLAHPNVVVVSDVVRVDGAPGLVMEYVRGPALDQLLARFSPSLAQVDLLVRQILGGIVAAHRHGLVHRDLKPANILVDVSGEAPVPKITDFGLAKVLSDLSDVEGSLTASGTTLGTPTFMAPEQFRSAKHVDARADVFSLGAILYELVTGLPAFRPGDLIDVFQQASGASFRPLAEVAPQAPARMVRAIEAALQPELGARVSSAEALLELWVAGVTPPDAWEPEHLVRLRGFAHEPEQPRAQTERPPTLGSLSVPAGGGATAVPATPPPDPPRRSLVGLPIVVGVGLLLGSVVALGGALLIVLWVLWPPAPVARVPEAPLSEEPLQDPDLLDGLEPQPPVEPAAPSAPAEHPRHPRPEAAPVPVPAPAPAPAPAPVPAPTPAPVLPVERAAWAELALEGVEGGYLVGASGQRAALGRIPPGTYTLHVYFDARTATPVMQLSLVAGEQRTVRCSSSLGSCR